MGPDFVFFWTKNKNRGCKGGYEGFTPRYMITRHINSARGEKERRDGKIQGSEELGSPPWLGTSGLGLGSSNSGRALVRRTLGPMIWIAAQRKAMVIKLLEVKLLCFIDIVWTDDCGGSQILLTHTIATHMICRLYLTDRPLRSSLIPAYTRTLFGPLAANLTTQYERTLPLSAFKSCLLHSLGQIPSHIHLPI